MVQLHFLEKLFADQSDMHRGDVAFRECEFSSKPDILQVLLASQLIIENNTPNLSRMVKSVTNKYVLMTAPQLKGTKS